MTSLDDPALDDVPAGGAPRCEQCDRPAVGGPRCVGDDCGSTRRRCMWCKRHFVVNMGDAGTKYCSRDCMWAANAEQRKGRPRLAPHPKRTRPRAYNGQGAIPDANDPELEAMNLVVAALEPLDPDARGRVARWAWQRYAHPSLGVDNPPGGKGI